VLPAVLCLPPVGDDRMLSAFGLAEVVCWAENAEMDALKALARRAARLHCFEKVVERMAVGDVSAALDDHLVGRTSCIFTNDGSLRGIAMIWLV